MQSEMNEAPPEYNFAGMTVFSSTFGGKGRARIPRGRPGRRLLVAEAWRAVKGRAAGEREGLQPDVVDDRRGDARADPVVTWSARRTTDRSLVSRLRLDHCEVTLDSSRAVRRPFMRRRHRLPRSTPPVPSDTTSAAPIRRLGTRPPGNPESSAPGRTATGGHSDARGHAGTPSSCSGISLVDASRSPRPAGGPGPPRPGRRRRQQPTCHRPPPVAAVARCNGSTPATRAPAGPAAPGVHDRKVRICRRGY